MMRQSATPPRQPGNAGESLSASRVSASYGRRRAVTACLVCRVRKTKCDNQRPVCGFCSSTGGACGYPDDTPSDHSKLDRGSLTILQRLGDMERNLAALINQRDGDKATPASQPAVYEPVDESFTLEDPSLITDAVHSQQEQQQQYQQQLDGDCPPAADVVTRSSEMRVENILKWPVFHAQDYPSLTSIIGQDDAHTPFVAGEGIFDLDPDLITQLVENFLATNHTKNPIFIVDQLWARVRDIAETGLRWDGTTCLVLLICAVSVLSPPFTAEQQPGYSKRIDRLKRAEHYFQMSQRRIGMLYHTNSLLAVQCSFLTAVYLMTTFRIMAAWKAFAQAGTQCVGRLTARGHAEGIADAQCADSTGMAQSDGEQHMEESLYWSCLKSELELRIELALPGSTLNDMQYSHVYPSPPSPRQLVAGGGHTLSEATEQQQREHARSRLETGWFFYLAEIALRRIMNAALSARYGVGSWYYSTRWWTAVGEGWFRSDVERFRQQLDTWRDMLPASMRFPSVAAEETGDALRGILRGHLVDILDVLYFPAVRAVACEPYDELGPYVRETAGEALRTAVYRITICEEGFWHRHQGTWLMIRTCSRSLLQLLAVAFRARDEPRLAALLPDGWKYAASRVLVLIEYWEYESADLKLMLSRMRAMLADLEQSSGQ